MTTPMKGWGRVLLRIVRYCDARVEALEKEAGEQEAAGLDICARASRADAQYWRDVAAANRKAPEYEEEEPTP